MRTVSNRLVSFGIVVFVCVLLIALSLSGILGPVQSLVAAPLIFVQRGVASVNTQFIRWTGQLANLQNLQAENEALQKALVRYQAELVQLREISADYSRIAALLNYRDRTTIASRQYVTAAAIGRDTTGLLHTITIDHGQRDGLAVGMPVVTDLGLVGRITAINASSAQILLLTDTSSYVNARLQDALNSQANGQAKPGTTPTALSVVGAANPIGVANALVEGTVVGTAGGDLTMTFITVGAPINPGDLAVTSGLGGNFPPGLAIGQVIASRLDDSQLFQQAQLRSLIDFTRLQTVLVITNFEAINLSAFTTPTASP